MSTPFICPQWLSGKIDMSENFSNIDFFFAKGSVFKPRRQLNFWTTSVMLPPRPLNRVRSVRLCYSCVTILIVTLHSDINYQLGMH